jgi:hypothetical protein
MKQSYNFLGSSCLFCYRGIFSGLSNETQAGTASYYFTAMDSEVLQLIATVNRYQRILFRYASILVKNKLAASLIVEDVFNDYQAKVADIAASEIRLFLQTTTVTKCAQWLAAKPVVHDMRKPKNPT